MKILAVLLFIFLISCKDTPLLCEKYINCDPNKEECKTAYEEAQKECESRKK